MIAVFLIPLNNGKENRSDLSSLSGLSGSRGILKSIGSPGVPGPAGPSRNNNVDNARKNMDPEQFIRGFRESSPYIHRFRGQTFVIWFDGHALLDDTFVSIASDIALLRSLGIGVVLVSGASAQIDSAFKTNGRTQQQTAKGPVTTASDIQLIRQAVGGVRFTIESALSQGGIDSSMSGAQLRVVSGNFVIARPLGVIDGVDLLFTGKPRQIRTDDIQNHLLSGEVVLISSLGVSLSGELFWLDSRDVARAVAEELEAEKLIFLLEKDAVFNRDGRPLREMTDREARSMIDSDPALSGEQGDFLFRAIETVRSGVDRVHLVNRHQDGALLLELFTRDGWGTLISADPFESIEQATPEDVPGILELIRPLEESGILKGRNREAIETDIAAFSVIRRDRKIIGCAALYRFPAERMGELACLAVHPDYRRSGRASSLLSWCEKKAREEKLDTLFVLSTQTGHYFTERGFSPCSLEELPASRRGAYNPKRRSLIFKKSL